MAIDYKSAFEKGRLHLIDDLENGDDRVGPSLRHYADTTNKNRNSLMWQRSTKWAENILFSSGRQYIDNIHSSRLANNSDTGVGDLSIIQEAAKSVPKPTNDLLGRYIESNVALLTENRPKPRVTPKSEQYQDIVAAELSELTIEYLWEALDLPEKHREIVRLMLHCGVCWMEVAYDPTVPRRMRVPETTNEMGIEIPEGAGGPSVNIVDREVIKVDKDGRPVYKEQVEYGDISSKIVSPFEMHLPSTHWWNGEDMGWIMRESYAPIEAIKDKYTRGGKTQMGLTKANGWNIDNLDKIQQENIMSLPLWWWNRLSELVEGPGTDIYVGSPDTWSGHAVVRVFDRKPNSKWPKGRTIITVGDVVIYDSPKKIGARAYDERWPNRWHPYIRFRWEPQTGSIYGRSLVSKLLPKLKRVNAIDTTMIMWRRTVPIAMWIAPKGSHVVEDSWSGRPGQIWEYDPRRTNANKPEPVYPPNYPSAALEERQQQIAEMEAIAGTEEILRGQRPIGVTSATMLDVLRKQALASRSAILQAWDESLQLEGSYMLQEVIKTVGSDPRYAERLRILGREKRSRITISNFAGTDLSDNVQVRVDTASMALVSKEAREAKMIEIMQYLPGLAAIDDIGLRQSIIEELGLKQALTPSGPDVHRAKMMISMVKQGAFDRVVWYKEDDPYVFHTLLVEEMKSEAFNDLPQEQAKQILYLIEIYEGMIRTREQMQAQLMAQMQMMQQQGPPEGEPQQ